MLTEKYEWPSKKARDFADFLEPMLEFDPNRRASAAKCLQHSWLESEESTTSVMSGVSGADGEFEDISDDEEDAKVVVIPPKGAAAAAATGTHKAEDNVNTEEVSVTES